jgi:two-component system OmpR family response regulator
MTDLTAFRGRRPAPQEQRVLRAGDLELDEVRWTARRGGAELELSPTEFRLLAYLMRNPGRVLSRAQLLEHVWGGSRGQRSQVVQTYVSYLRRKLDAHGPRVIHTQRGAGYLLRPVPGRSPVLPARPGGPGDESGELPYPHT